MAVLNTCVGLYAKDNAMNGSPPVTTAPNFQIQAGQAGIVFSGGAGVLTFPTSFANGLLSIVTTLQVPASSASSTCGPVNGGSFGPGVVSLWAAIGGSSLTGDYNVTYIAIGF